MSGFFSAIKDFFSTIYGIFEFIFKAIGMLFNLLTSGLQFLFSLIQLLPTPFIVGGLALVVVCILYKVLGRETES